MTFPNDSDVWKAIRLRSNQNSGIEMTFLVCFVLLLFNKSFQSGLVYNRRWNEGAHKR